MSDDVSTAYICIYCPFNSDNLQALENHLINAHGYANQDGIQSQSSLNIPNKANKREVPHDEQSFSSFDGVESIAEFNGVKRLKRTSSPMSTKLLVNVNPDDSDERDSSLESKSLLSNKNVTCSTCNIIYPNFAQLFRHAKRKHQIDLSNSNRTEMFDLLSKLTNVDELSDGNQMNSTDLTKSDEEKIEHCPTPSSFIGETTVNADPTATTDCPYCDFKTMDIEHFKCHIIDHIRDKNYRCLLCNRLYKYRGDCSFHIRRKHHRYSSNFNDYIQRFVFDTSDGDESMSTQVGRQGSTINGSITHSNVVREQEEPARYFGCPYCDYTSNYGGDVRKHQARKHPNVESKVVKIMRQDCEQQNVHLNRIADFEDEDEDDEDDSNVDVINPIEGNPICVPFQSTSLPILSNFAPVRVFQCSACHQQGTYKWVVERHIRAKHPDQIDAHVIELPAELSVKLQKITSPLKRYRCSLCSLQSKHSWVVMRHIKHFHTLQTASVVDIQPDGKAINDQSMNFVTGDLSNKCHQPDSESSSVSSSFVDLVDRQEADEDQIENPSSTNNNDSIKFNYKCSLCDQQSNVSFDIQKHINEKHGEQTNASVVTQCRQTKLLTNDLTNQKLNSIKCSKGKSGNVFHRSLSPASAVAKAKFSPAIEEALLSLQGSKLNPHLYAVQPKFGIKRLKCRHCFYRSNWKTDMIRHVRIRHNLTEPDHHKDMIIMTEQEARGTIETYENTFGKELRRRTFRTWNDWAKAEEEFTPKDGSLQYTGTNGGQMSNLSNNSIPPKHLRSIEQKCSSTSDEIKRSNKMIVKKESHQISQQKVKSSIVNPSTISVEDEFKQLANPSNIVSRLLLTTSPINKQDDGDEVPLDLSLKSSIDMKIEHSFVSPKQQSFPIDEEEEDNSTVQYRCSECPYENVNRSSVQRHLSVHITGQGRLCPLCSFTSLSDDSMIRHFRVIHPTSHIPATFRQTCQVLTAHIVEQYKCCRCSYECDHLEEFNLHKHLEEEEEEEYDIDSADDDVDLPVTTTKNVFECPLCSPSCERNNSTNLEEFTMHVVMNHHNQSCPFCSFTMNTSCSQSLIEHIKLHFNATLIQPDPIIALEQVKELLMLE